MGEYFKLHTEQLGGVSGETSDDQRPNFGHLITSPPKRRPHPPLVNISTSQGGSCPFYLLNLVFISHLLVEVHT